MFRRIGLAFVALALFSIAGGQWAVVQSIAWAEMLRDNARRAGSLTVAVQQTFDGEHPCELCRKIQTAKSQDRKESPALPGGKEIAKVTALVANSTLGATRSDWGEESFAGAAPAFAPDRTDAPPTPPPRGGDLTA